jgi:hypothetical protein
VGSATSCDDQGGRDRGKPRPPPEGGSFPGQQDGERHQRDQQRAGGRLRHRRGDLGERVPAVGLGELQVTLVRRRVAQRVRNLLEDEDDADAGQHPLDHRGREVVADDARAQEARDDLKDAGDHDGEQEGLKAQVVDGRENDHGHPGRGAADAERRPADQRHDQAADDAGDHAGGQRGAGRQRDTEAQGQRDQEDDRPGDEVGGSVFAGKE